METSLSGELDFLSWLIILFTQSTTFLPKKKTIAENVLSEYTDLHRMVFLHSLYTVSHFQKLLVFNAHST